jgi:hypothetical protein
MCRRHQLALDRVIVTWPGDLRSTPRPAAGQRLHVRPPRPAGAQLLRSALRGVRRTFVLGACQQLRDEDEQHHLPCSIRVCARPATRPEGDDEERGEIAPHRS